jgi:transcriptional regulator with XRE-family HTH domain
MTKASLAVIQKKIGSAVTEARKRNGFTQQALARALKTRQANISRIERGLQNLSLDFLVRLDHILGLGLSISFR